MSGELGATEVAGLLSELGVDTKEARILAFLAAEGTGASPDLERACRLRQPQVSLATKTLRERGWVTAEERQNGTRGRPVHVYRLDMSFAEIVAALEEEARQRIRDEIAAIARLRNLLHRRPMPTTRALK